MNVRNRPNIVLGNVIIAVLTVLVACNASLAIIAPPGTNELSRPLLNPFLEHGLIVDRQQGGGHMNAEIRIDADQIGVEGGVVGF